jgi:hypothetical protein
MTRIGSTPYLQSPGFKMELSASVSNSSDGPEWESVELTRSEGFYEELYRYQYKAALQEGKKRLRLAVSSMEATGIEDYMSVGGLNVSDLRFGILIVSTSSRVRKFEKGTIQYDAKEKKASINGEFIFNFEDLSGNFEIEPVIILMTETTCPLTNVKVRPGTVIASGASIILENTLKPDNFIDWFKFEWVNFDASPEFRAESRNDLDFELDPPVIYLDEDIANFHHIMNKSDNERGKQPKAVVARRAHDRSIAMDVLMRCVATVVENIREQVARRISEDPEFTEYDDIFDSLRPNERNFITYYPDIFAVRSGAIEPRELCSELARASQSTIFQRLTKTIPRNINCKLGASDVVKAVQELAGYEND